MQSYDYGFRLVLTFVLVSPILFFGLLDPFLALRMLAMGVWMMDVVVRHGYTSSFFLHVAVFGVSILYLKRINKTLQTPGVGLLVCYLFLAGLQSINGLHLEFIVKNLLGICSFLLLVYWITPKLTPAQINLLLKDYCLGVLIVCLLLLLSMDYPLERRLGEAILQNPNAMGLMVTFAGLLSIYLWFTGRARGFGNLILLVTFCVVLVLTGSRAALVALIVGGAIMVYAFKRRYLIYAPFLLIPLFLQLVDVDSLRAEGIFTHLFRGLSEQSYNVFESANLRLEILARGWELFVQKPILGYGLGNFQFVAQVGSDTAMRILPAHNLFLTSAIEMGVFGVFILTIWILIVFKYLFVDRHVFALSIFAVLFIQSLTHGSFLGVLYGIPFGFALATSSFMTKSRIIEDKNL